MLHPNEPLLFTPSVEVLLISYLTKELKKYAFPYTENIHVAISADGDSTSEHSNLVTVLAGNGGSSERFSSEVPVVITSYSTSRSNALSLASLVEALIHRAPIEIADIFFTAALGGAIVDEEINSDRVFSRFQNFIVRAKKQAL